MAALTDTIRIMVPGDKSVSHRALIFAALATGVSRIGGILDSADVRSTAGVLQSLGIHVPAIGPTMMVTGAGLRGLRPSAAPLDCGNSGTTTRLMAGVLAGHPFSSEFIGDASLSGRPMRRVAQPLEAMGAHITLTASGTLPMRVDGASLHTIRWQSETSSAQVKSAILLAGLVSGAEVTVIEPTPSRDHTERFLRALGADLRVDAGITLVPPASLRPFALAVPGDPSSAAFFAALGALGVNRVVELPNVLASATRDGFFRALARMGTHVESELPVITDAGELVTTYRVSPGPVLRGTTVDAAQVPGMVDEIPLLACVAACADGETRVTGAGELRVKESDRIATTVANLRAVGADADELPDGFVVRGAPGRALRGTIATHGDHRIAMAFAILGARPGNAIMVDAPDCVAVSYPGFWADLRRATA